MMDPIRYVWTMSGGGRQCRYRLGVEFVPKSRWFDSSFRHFLTCLFVPIQIIYFFGCRRTMSTSRQAPISALNITFLGTASAQPSSTRNHSALALRVGGDVWLFDCGEATQHQIQKSNIKMGKIDKIFITHTHGKIFTAPPYSTHDLANTR